MQFISEEEDHQQLSSYRQKIIQAQIKDLECDNDISISLQNYNQIHHNNSIDINIEDQDLSTVTQITLDNVQEDVSIKYIDRSINYVLYLLV